MKQSCRISLDLNKLGLEPETDSHVVPESYLISCAVGVLQQHMYGSPGILLSVRTTFKLPTMTAQELDRQRSQVRVVASFRREDE